MIREVTLEDSAEIAAIYNWYIENTSITFEVENVSPQEMARRIADYTGENPFLVLEQEGEIIGYAYACAWKARHAYSLSRETSIYLLPDYYGRGHGSRLYQRLIDEIRKTRVHVLLAGIALPNEGSIALHEKLGFSKVGELDEVGRKFDSYVNVGYWQLTL